MANENEVAICLGAQNLCKRYGSVEANRNISLAVSPGQIHAIVGENGAGKSTLMRIFQGMEPPDSGQIIVDDQAVQLHNPQQAFALGIGMVHQELMLASDLTLLENLVLGDEPTGHDWGLLSFIDWQAAKESGEALAHQTSVEIDWERKAGGTPVHLQQFVEIIRLLRRGAKKLILDEPTAVLAPQQVTGLFQLLKHLRNTGTTIVFISHKLHEVMSIADHVTVIRRGQVCFTSPVAKTDIPTIARHMMGSEPTFLSKKDAGVGLENSEPLLEVLNLSAPSIERSHPLHEISLSVGHRELVGVAGVSGNGQTELVECLVGLREASEGQIRLADEDITHTSTQERRNRGLGYVSANRREEGLALDATVEVNVVAGRHRIPPIGLRWVLNLASMHKVARASLDGLAVQYRNLNDKVRSLSGGNQQKLVFAREIAMHPRLLIVSQPTRGVDIKGIASIHAILRDFCQSGGSVLLVSEELEELLALSDRIVVMAGGRVVNQLSSEQASVSLIGKWMLTKGST